MPDTNQPVFRSHLDHVPQSGFRACVCACYTPRPSGEKQESGAETRLEADGAAERGRERTGSEKRHPELSKDGCDTETEVKSPRDTGR